MSRIFGALSAGIIVGLMAFVILLFLIKLLWAWTVPDLFPQAVVQGLVAAKVSWFTAAKIAIILAVFSGMSAGHRSGHSSSGSA